MARCFVPGVLMVLTLASNLLTFLLLLMVTLHSDLRSLSTQGLRQPLPQDAPSETKPSEGEFVTTDLLPEDVAFLNAQEHRDVAIVVPYRDRDFQLRVFAAYMNHLLTHQNITYRIYIIEQSPAGLFNRAKLMNIGFVEAMSQHEYTCVIFHDVDLLPEVPGMTYACQTEPVHMSVAVNTFNYTLPYEKLFGGVSAMTPDVFSKVNGFSNVYWGWGGEDDDMYRRLSAASANIRRPSPTLGRYTMLTGQSHTASKKSTTRYYYLRNSLRRMLKDGLNSLHYTVLTKAFSPLYTRITVDTHPPWGARFIPKYTPTRSPKSHTENTTERPSMMASIP